jgi:hypothetical protein
MWDYAIFTLLDERCYLPSSSGKLQTKIVCYYLSLSIFINNDHSAWSIWYEIRWTKHLNNNQNESYIIAASSYEFMMSWFYKFGVLRAILNLVYLVHYITLHTYIHTQHTYLFYISLHTYIRAYTHGQTHTYRHYIVLHTLYYITYIYTYITLRTYAHIHTKTHIHTHIYIYIATYCVAYLSQSEWLWCM